MKFSANEVFEQSLQDRHAGQVDSDGYRARMRYGTKISRDNLTGEVEFFNCTKGGNMYALLTPTEINIFLEKGWVCGVYVVYLSNNRLKLDIIERSIRREVNEKNNPATIKSLKAKQERIFSRYNKVNLLLKSIQDGTI
jgi:hypothetical protein|tara:strand:+ start:1892 stop:2308 length:417 start_codon:yes stop_codon:yes gene_type:complete